jgi:hypothetical protein
VTSAQAPRPMARARPASWNSGNSSGRRKNVHGDGEQRRCHRGPGVLAGVEDRRQERDQDVRHQADEEDEEHRDYGATVLGREAPCW